jgi:hypothetical protein
MLDNYSNETLLCNQLHTFLILNQYLVLQLISPGGQATYSITFTESLTQKKKTIYPDAILLKDNTILIGEIKPKFSLSDKKKLLELKDSTDGEKNIKLLIERMTSKDVCFFTITYLLIHGSSKFSADSKITQLVLNATGSIFF